MTKARKTGHGAKSRRDPSRAIHGADPQMASSSTQSLANGEAKNLLPTLRQFVGEVRVGWIVFTLLASGILHFSSSLLTYGWITVPAKQSDMAEVQKAVVALGENVKFMSAALTRLEESDKANQRAFASMDHKLDILLDRRPSQLETGAPSAPPPPASHTSTRARRYPKKEHGLF